MKLFVPQKKILKKLLMELQNNLISYPYFISKLITVISKFLDVLAVGPQIPTPPEVQIEKSPFSCNP